MSSRSTTRPCRAGRNGCASPRRHCMTICRWPGWSRGCATSGPPSPSRPPPRLEMVKPLLRALSGQTQPRPPVWLMRQAGRYLPEYHATRARASSFLDLCYNSELAAEVTLQPIRRYGLDAAILFSDILVVPHALGQALDYVEGEGPKLDAAAGRPGPRPPVRRPAARGAGAGLRDRRARGGGPAARDRADRL